MQVDSALYISLIAAADGEEVMGGRTIGAEPDDEEEGEGDEEESDAEAVATTKAAKGTGAEAEGGTADEEVAEKGGKELKTEPPETAEVTFVVEPGGRASIGASSNEKLEPQPPTRKKKKYKKIELRDAKKETKTRRQRCRIPSVTEDELVCTSLTGPAQGQTMQMERHTKRKQPWKANACLSDAESEFRGQCFAHAVQRSSLFFDKGISTSVPSSIALPSEVPSFLLVCVSWTMVKGKAKPKPTSTGAGAAAGHASAGAAAAALPPCLHVVDSAVQIAISAKPNAKSSEVTGLFPLFCLVPAAGSDFWLHSA